MWFIKKVNFDKVGIKVSNSVLTVLNPGHHIIFPNEKLLIFPKNYIIHKFIYSRFEHPTHFNYNSIEGILGATCLTISFYYDKKKILDMFEKYILDHKGIIDLLQKTIQGTLHKIASKLTIEDICGKEKITLIDSVTAHVREMFYDDGIVIDSIDYIGEMYITPDVYETFKKNTITKNKLKKAEFDTALELEKATRNAMVNDILSESPSMEERIEIKKIEKWNGKLPTNNEHIIKLR